MESRVTDVLRILKREACLKKKTPKTSTKISSGPAPNAKLVQTISKSELIAAHSKCQPVHYRRCHLCDHVTEQAGEVVTQCGQCGKHMAPFYFFNEVEVTPYTDNHLRPELPRPEQLARERVPVRGFTSYW
jgi:hypothetical protein